MSRRTLIVACALLTGCAAGNSVPSPAARSADASPQWIVGEVRVVGSLPVDVTTILVEPSGLRTELGGSLRSQLRSLSGAEVAVYGVRSAGSIEASDYEIRTIDGEPVIVGVVEATAQGDLRIRTRRGELFEIGGLVGSLEPGQTVWLQGRAAIQVESFGVIAR